MQVHFTVEPEDFAAFQRHFFATSELGRRARRLNVLIAAPLAAAPLVLGAVLFRLWGVALVLALVLGLVLVPAVRAAERWFLERSIRDLLRSGVQGTLGPRALLLEDAGIVARAPGSESRHAWANVARIERTGEHLLLWLDAQMAHIVPLRAFASAAEADAFEARARALRDGA